MKKLVIWCFIGTFILLLSACGTNEVSPELEASSIQTLKVGSRGPCVSYAQSILYNKLQRHGNLLAANALAKSSFRNGKWDGIFGWGTYHAVVAFQQLVFPGQPHEWDGIIGPKTWRALGSRCSFYPPRNQSHNSTREGHRN